MERKPIILFRDINKDQEIEIAKKYFDVTPSRSLNVADKIVIGRYSVLPLYQEVEFDLNVFNAKLINSYNQHNYVAFFDYYKDIEQFTAQTWFRLEDVPKDSGPWVVKGRTNSKKNLWKTQMFAEKWEDLVRIYLDLSIDPMLAEQGIVIRKFLDFEIVEYGLSQPFFNEWRFFFYNGNLLSYGFYWSNSEIIGTINQEGVDFAKKIAKICCSKIPFVVIDIGRLKTGEWKVVELNDGQQSGLSLNDPEILYKNLASHFK